MSKRVGGFINQDGLNAPDSPTGVSASAGDEQATVSFTAPSDVGGSAVTGYVATSNDGIGATGSSSPITVTGLTNDTAYTFRVWALNAFGYSAPSGASGSVTPAAPIGVFAGGYTTVAVNTMDYIVLATSGNATDFGDLAAAILEHGTGSAGSGTRGLFFGGENSGGSKVNTISRITFATLGNSSDFGDMTVVRNSSGTLSSSTRAICGGGGDSNVIDFVTIATDGNATDFGDLNINFKTTGVSGLASPTRGVFSSVSDGGSDVLQYITIASAGNATDFGDLLISGQRFGSGSSTTRGIFTGGSTSNVIQFITIASTGNATDFGDLSAASETNSAVTSETVMAIALASDGSVNLDTIDQITIASAGNATDFGDLTQARRLMGGGASVAHGGLS